MLTLKVLVVEDSTTQLVKIKFSLLNAGYEVIVATNGHDGYMAAVADRPDVILLDMVMPVLDGPGMLLKLRDDDELWNIPVIMLTALSEADSIRKVLSLGAKGYIIKPFNLEVFEDKLKVLFPQVDFSLSPTDKIKTDIDRRIISYEEIGGIHVFAIPSDRLSIGVKLAFSYIRRLLAAGGRKFVVDFSTSDMLSSEDMSVLISSAASLQKGIEFVIFLSASEGFKSQLGQYFETAKIKLIASRTELPTAFS